MGKQDEFDNTGERVAYISLDEATILARNMAVEGETNIFDRVGWQEIVWEEKSRLQYEDSYRVVMQFRLPVHNSPQEQAGEEEFIFGLTGQLMARQVLVWPKPSKARLGLPSPTVLRDGISHIGQTLRRKRPKLQPPSDIKKRITTLGRPFRGRRPTLQSSATLIGRIAVVQGDITILEVDAIVNAANNSLLGGAGVDGAIHRAAGPELLQECRSLDGCETGQAKITSGYNLPAHWVIHTVGPVWDGGGQGEAALLASCYESCLVLADQYSLKTIAFPAISTGAYRFPMELATRIAVDEVSKFLTYNSKVEKVTFVCFNQEANRAYAAAVQELAGG